MDSKSSHLSLISQRRTCPPNEFGFLDTVAFGLLGELKDTYYSVFYLLFHCTDTFGWKQKLRWTDSGWWYYFLLYSWNNFVL